jgi:hypothetical protein
VNRRGRRDDRQQRQGDGNRQAQEARHQHSIDGRLMGSDAVSRSSRISPGASWLRAYFFLKKPMRGKTDLLKEINLIWPVQSCRRKQFVSLTGQITFRTPSSRPDQRGVSRSSRTWVRDAVDAAAPGAQRNRRAGFWLVSDGGVLTNGVRSGRQSRVVLAPVAGVKLSEAKSAQPGSTSPNPATTVTRRIRRRGERGISR